MRRAQTLARTERLTTLLDIPHIGGVPTACTAVGRKVGETCYSDLQAKEDLPPATSKLLNPPEATTCRHGQNGLLYNPGFSFTTRLHVCFQTFLDIPLVRSHVAKHLLIADAALTGTNFPSARSW